MKSSIERIELEAATFDLLLDGSRVIGIGEIRIDHTRVRNGQPVFWPYLDTLEGDWFDQYELRGIERVGRSVVIRTATCAGGHTMFRERRDSSGDLCLRRGAWGRNGPTAEVDLVFEPVEHAIGAITMTGFRYHFAYRGDQAPIHRLLDRQTWEPGGTVQGNTLCLRNWLTPPRVRLSRRHAHSTVGNGKWSHLLPGNLWARWSLLPGFELIYGDAGVLVGRYDRMSLIRSVIETDADEDVLRVIDMHLFAQSREVRTNPKTILFAARTLDDAAAIDLWTLLQDQQQGQTEEQLGIRRNPAPQPVISHNAWVDFDFRRTYDASVDRAARVGARYVFIDPIWVNQESLRRAHRAAAEARPEHQQVLDAFWPQSMCCTMDFKVAREFGGEAGLRDLCDRAGKQGVGIISWMACHLSPNTMLRDNSALGIGEAGIFAAGESGRHPATGYPASCWPLNLNAPIADYLREALFGVCDRTGLAGYLWDSFCNLGWWQVDYSNGTLAPQHEQMGHLYADLVNHGLYIAPEALVTFSQTSCCGMHGGEIYDGEMLPYAYRSSIPFWLPDVEANQSYELRLIAGRADRDLLFRSLAHQRCPMLSIGGTAIEEDPDAVAGMRRLLLAYRRVSPWMQRRSILPDQQGVRWRRDDGADVLFSFSKQPAEGRWMDATDQNREAGRQLEPGRIYFRPPEPVVCAKPTKMLEQPPGVH